MAIVFGVHPVREALRAGRPVERVVIATGAGGTRLQEIIDEARQRKVPVRFEPRAALERAAPGETHQGVIAFVAAQPLATTEEADGDVIIVLDGVEDPHNLGAVIRTANAVGAASVIIPDRRSASVTETVAKAAAGALEYTRVVKVNNINRTLEEFKQKGYWIYGLDERGESTCYETEFVTPTVLVFGGEGRGLHVHTRKHCDFVIRIPMYGQISSLNVSVAAGVVLYEWRRQNP
jgi:23S rRNA (guanosine2251-2'-O)-methyltransferase